jgi:hypothetical protein
MIGGQMRRSPVRPTRRCVLHSCDPPERMNCSHESNRQADAGNASGSRDHRDGRVGPSGVGMWRSLIREPDGVYS